MASVLHRLTPMLRLPKHALLVAAVFAGSAAVALVGCSSGGADQAATLAPASPAQQPPDAQSNQPIGLSPGGVTTRIDIPAQSTEEQYAQACFTAKEWMQARGGDPDDLVEPYLKDVQGSTTSGRATFGKTWTELSGAQQAGVIIAVRAAADGGC